MTLIGGKNSSLMLITLNTVFILVFAQAIPSRTGALKHEMKLKYEEEKMAFSTETNKQVWLSLCQVQSCFTSIWNGCSVFSAWMNARRSTSSLPAICCSHHCWSSGFQNKLELNTASNHQIQYVHPSLSGSDRRPNMGTDCSSQDVIGVRKWAENNVADPLCHEYNLSPQAV